MSETQKEFVDAWATSGEAIQALPDDAALICTYGVNVGIDTIDETAFFRRAEGSDELWITWWYIASNLPKTTVHGDSNGAEEPIGAYCAVRLAAEGGPAAACARLLDRLIRARVGFGWPDGFMRAGIINAAAFKRIVDSIKTELDRNAARAQSRDSEIVTVARQLQLQPEPTGTGEDHWRANCPTSHHFLELRGGKNVFYCGWCKRGGNPDELRAFAQEREARGAREAVIATPSASSRS